MFLEPVSLHEVANIFQNLKKSTPDHDELTPNILRLCFPTIKEPLVYIFIIMKMMMMIMIMMMMMMKFV